MAIRPCAKSDCGAGGGDSDRPPTVPLSASAYNWIMRRRLFYWYGQLKALEASFDASPTDKHLTEKQAEIERIEDAVSHIRFPLTFSDQVYNLRSHIDIVRRKITSRVNAPGGWRLNNRNVRFGSKADMCSAKRHVRFTPKSGHCGCNYACPLCAKADLGNLPYA